MNDITGYPLVPLEKNENDVYPFPRIRYGVLPYHVNHTGQIIWGCIESNRIEPITLAPAAGTQDIIAIKDKQRIVLESGKPLPDLNIEGLLTGQRFRDQVYQNTIDLLVIQGYSVYLEDPLATAIHEAHEEHGIDLCKINGRDQLLLKKSLELSPQFSTPEHKRVATLCIWLAELTNYESVELRYTEKTDKKMFRNFGRQFYEKGCWITLKKFETQLHEEKEKFSLERGYSQEKTQLIAETFDAFELHLQLLRNIEATILKTADNSKQCQQTTDELYPKQGEQSPTFNTSYPYTFFNPASITKTSGNLCENKSNMSRNETTVKLDNIAKLI